MDITTVFFFFFNDTATTEIYTLSLHDALPICAPPTSSSKLRRISWLPPSSAGTAVGATSSRSSARRSEEHTSELQSQSNLVCRLLLEKKNICPDQLRSATPPAGDHITSHLPPH